MGPCTYISRCRIECQIFFSELSPDFFPPSVPSSLLSFPRYWIGLHLSLYVFESEEGDDNKCETDTKGGGGRSGFKTLKILHAPLCICGWLKLHKDFRSMSCVCDENSLGRSKQVRLFVLKPDPIWVVRVGLAAAAAAGS